MESENNSVKVATKPLTVNDIVDALKADCQKFIRDNPNLDPTWLMVKFEAAKNALDTYEWYKMKPARASQFTPPQWGTKRFADFQLTPSKAYGRGDGDNFKWGNDS